MKPQMTTDQMAIKALEPVRQYLSTHGRMPVLVKMMERMTGQKFYRQLIVQYFEEGDKRRTPSLGLGLLMIEAVVRIKRNGTE